MTERASIFITLLGPVGRGGHPGARTSNQGMRVCVSYGLTMGGIEADEEMKTAVKSINKLSDNSWLKPLHNLLSMQLSGL
jgi:hypothetical protein